ncbi:DUF308 domain-containing protein [Halosquirtibacter xylanolyticus]|uniref:HdeD family acid-resistance protein n=1 Tax=Halosquirtibacter xylanolyticus TaxID=3374599 RepID=UPI0037485618|nr:DUF308 domain-containing protein [Prolixibacteraceae bacterium]
MKHFHLVQHRRNLLRGILGLVFGGVMLFVPGITAKLILICLGAIFLLIGLSGLVITSKKMSTPFRSFLHTESFISMLIGLLLVLFPVQLTELFSIIVGIGFLLMGIRQMVSYFQTAKYMAPSKIYLVTAILVFGIGLYLLLIPTALMRGVVFIVGLVLMVYGINELLLYFQVNRTYKKRANRNIDDVDFEEL